MGSNNSEPAWNDHVTRYRHVSFILKQKEYFIEKGIDALRRRHGCNHDNAGNNQSPDIFSLGGGEAWFGLVLCG